jgi:hypothetical protein
MLWPILNTWEKSEGKEYLIFMFKKTGTVATVGFFSGSAVGQYIPILLWNMVKKLHKRYSIIICIWK